MEQVRVGLETLPVGGLKGAQFFRLPFTGVDRESFVDEKIPDFLAAFPGVERFVLGVADAAEFRIGRGGLGPVAVTYDLEHAFALVDLLAQHPAQIARLGAENILPNRLITEKAQGISGELAAAAKFAANGRNKNERKRSHGL
jgi:hypothetical protein